MRGYELYTFLDKFELLVDYTDQLAAVLMRPEPRTGARCRTTNTVTPAVPASAGLFAECTAHERARKPTCTRPHAARRGSLGQQQRCAMRGARGMLPHAARAFARQQQRARQSWPWPWRAKHLPGPRSAGCPPHPRAASAAAGCHTRPRALAPAGSALPVAAARRWCATKPPPVVGHSAELIEQRYQRKTPVEHVLLRPGMYIGAIEMQEGLAWTYAWLPCMLVCTRSAPPLLTRAVQTLRSRATSPPRGIHHAMSSLARKVRGAAQADGAEAAAVRVASRSIPPRRGSLRFRPAPRTCAPCHGGCIVRVASPTKPREIPTRKTFPLFPASRWSPALCKLFDEILVNAADNTIRDPAGTSRIEVSVFNGSPAKGWPPRITIVNNGLGIPVVRHPVEQLYIPELVFGHLMTGSNFSDDSDQLAGGRHGYGAKLTNIFSTEFTVETADTKTGLGFRQTWRSNMSEVTSQETWELAPGAEDFTSISFVPDLDRLGFGKRRERFNSTPLGVN